MQSLYDEQERKRRQNREYQRHQKRRRYHERRAALITKLGGKCVHCGEEDAAKIEFNHKTPRTWEAKRTSRLQRIRHYERETVEGKIELACRTCNKKLGQPVDEDYVEEPIPE